MYVGGVDYKSRGISPGRFSYQGLKHNLERLTVNLWGRHQYKNAAVALAVIELLQEKGFPVPEAAIREGLAGVRWPG